MGVLDPQFVLVGFLCSLIGASSYAWATWTGRVRPNLVTWVLWFVAPMVAFAAQFSSGVGWPALMTFSVGFGPGLICAAALGRAVRLRHRGEQVVWKTGRFDYVCGALSAGGTIALAATGNPVTALALAIAADTLAGLPTVRKAWVSPDTESPWAYLLASINATIALLCLPELSFLGAGFAIYVLVLCLPIAVIVVFRDRPTGPDNQAVASDLFE